jgi:ribosomal protein L28
MAVKRKLLRGHYNPTVKRKQKANIQKKMIKTTQVKNGKKIIINKKLNICTQCLKSLYKTQK